MGLIVTLIVLFIWYLSACKNAIVSSSFDEKSKNASVSRGYCTYGNSKGQDIFIPTGQRCISASTKYGSCVMDLNYNILAECRRTKDGKIETIYLYNTNIIKNYLTELREGRA